MPESLRDQFTAATIAYSVMIDSYIKTRLQYPNGWSAAVDQIITTDIQAAWTRVQRTAHQIAVDAGVDIKI